MTSSSQQHVNPLPGRAIVTGAARGIGAAISQALARQGFEVVGIDHQWPAGRAAGANERTVDLADLDAIEEFARSLTDEPGVLSILVNNAALTVRGPLAELAASDIARIVRVDLEASLHLCRLLIPSMGPGSSIINVTSVRASRGFANDAPYIAAKGAMESLTRALAVELGPAGIRVNAVAPGIIETDMNRTTLAQAEVRERLRSQVPLGRLGSPEDVARAVEFLVSPAAEYVSGAVLPVDGGWATGR